MVREEGKRDKMKTRMGRRTIAYEEKLERGEGTLGAARRCWEEIKEMGGRRGSLWEEQRKNFYEERGLSVEWVREKGREVREVVERRDREIQ